MRRMIAICGLLLVSVSVYAKESLYFRCVMPVACDCDVNLKVNTTDHTVQVIDRNGRPGAKAAFSSTIPVFTYQHEHGLPKQSMALTEFGPLKPASGDPYYLRLNESLFKEGARANEILNLNPPASADGKALGTYVGGYLFVRNDEPEDDILRECFYTRADQMLRLRKRF